MYKELRRSAFIGWVLLCLLAVIISGHGAILVIPAVAIVTLLFLGIERIVMSMVGKND